MILPIRTLFVLFFALNFTIRGFAQNNHKELSLHYESPSTSLIELNQKYKKIYSLNEKAECILYTNLGTAHFQLNNTDSALHFFNHALNITSKSEFRTTEIAILKKLGDLFKSQANYKEAAEYYSLAISKEKQIAKFEEEKIDNGVSVLYKNGVIALLSILIAFLFFRNKILKKKIQNQQERDLTPTPLNTYLVSFKTLNNQLQFALSQREYEVLCFVVKSQTNTLIAEELFISVNTVKTHLKNIFEKLEVANRKEAIEKVMAIKIDELK